MPIFEYKCEVCEHKQQNLVNSSSGLNTQKAICEKCGGIAFKVISACAGVVKGIGAYSHKMYHTKRNKCKRG